MHNSIHDNIKHKSHSEQNKKKNKSEIHAEELSAVLERITSEQLFQQTQSSNNYETYCFIYLAHLVIIFSILIHKWIIWMNHNFYYKAHLEKSHLAKRDIFLFKPQ